MKRVAVCFAGQPRFFERTIEYFDHNLFNLPDIACDLFIHSWDYDDSIGKLFVKGQPQKGVITNNYREALLSKNPVVASFSPPLYSIEEATTVDHFIIMQMYSRNKVIELLNEHIEKTNIVYDHCIMTRPDLILFNPCEFPPGNELGCQEWPTWSDDTGKKMPNDQLLISSVSTITEAVRKTYIEHKQRGIWKSPIMFWFCEELLAIATQHMIRYPISTRFTLMRDGQPDGT